MVLFPPMRLEGRRDVPPPCDKRKNLFAVDISQVALSGPDQRVCREYLVPVMVSITASAVATAGRGLLWRVCLVGYQCGGEAGTLGSGWGFTFGSDDMCTLGRDEGSFPQSGGGCGGGLGGVWIACCRICATWR